MPMQVKLRSQPEEDFKSLDKFMKMQEDKKLITLERCGRFLAFVLLDTLDAEFIEQEWDVRTEAYMHRWEEKQQD